MSSLPALLLVTALFPAADADTVIRRYVKPVDASFVTDAELTQTTGDLGPVYELRTVRGKETTTVKLRYEKDHLKFAELTLEADKTVKKKVEVRVLNDTDVSVQRGGGVQEIVKLAGPPVLTTDPDWSGILDLMRRYDRRKGGKQEFGGLWIGFRPGKDLEKATLSVERLGPEKKKVTYKDRDLPLDRYRIELAGGPYLVWADAAGKAVKLLPNKPDSTPIFLEGYEDATRDLGPEKVEKEK